MSEPRSIKAKITKATVDAESIPECGESRIWDTQSPGFCLRVYPSGRKSAKGRKVYAVKYRVAGRRQRWFTIGEHGKPWVDPENPKEDKVGNPIAESLTADRARTEADRIIADAKRGNDHQAAKLELRADLTIAQLIDLYLERGPAAKPSKRDSSWAQDKSSLTRHVKPLIGAKTCRSLRPADVTKMAKDIASGKTAADEKTIKRGRAIVTGGQTVAARTVATVSAMFAWAMTHGGLKLSANPARGAVGNLGRLPAKERFLTAEESTKLFETITAMEADKTLNKMHADIFRLLMLTGARKTEIAGLRWSEVDLKRSRLTLPPDRTKAGEKSGERRIALAAAAGTILAKRAGASDAFVFPAHRGEGHVVGLQKSWATIRLQAGLPDLRIHDLRHSYASFAIADGASLFMVSRALGHADTRVTERYAHIQGDALDLLAEGAALRMGVAPPEASDE